MNLLLNEKEYYLGTISPDISKEINRSRNESHFIKDGKTTEKKKLKLPKKIVNVEKCKNPRCITSVEQELDHVFYLANEEKHLYRCLYCETKVSKK